MVMEALSLTANLSRPYATSAVLLMLVVSAVAAYDFNASRGDEPLFGQPLLDRSSPHLYPRGTALAIFSTRGATFMKCVIKSFILASAAVAVLAPVQARADGFVTPWVGSAFGSNIKNGQTTLGVSAGGMGAGIIGGEADFGWSPSFFGTQSDFGNNTVMNLMGNLIIGVPIGGQHGAGVRPYVVGGVGLIRSQIDGGSLTNFAPAQSTNMFGWDAGAGVMGYFSDHVGLRGDVRYLRAVSDLTTNVRSIDINGDKLHFWRATVGVVFR